MPSKVNHARLRALWVVAIGKIVVSACDASNNVPRPENIVWHVLANDGPNPLSEITYGGNASGFRTVVAAKPLSPGCYIVDTSAGASYEFIVSQNGAIVTRSGSVP